MTTFFERFLKCVKILTVHPTEFVNSKHSLWHQSQFTKCARQDILLFGKTNRRPIYIIGKKANKRVCNIKIRPTWDDDVK